MTKDRIARIDAALALVRAEVIAASKKFATFNSPREGYAVIAEELDELWAEVKANRGYGFEGTIEAKQVAAMAVRYLVDLSGVLEALSEEGDGAR